MNLRVTAAILVACVLTALNAWYCATIWHNFQIATRMEQWPTAVGTITSSTLINIQTSTIDRSFVPKVTYRYTVDGVEYESSRIAIVTPQGDVHIGDRFRMGSQVQVYYDPAHPGTAYLQKGFLGLRGRVMGAVMLECAAFLVPMMIVIARPKEDISHTLSESGGDLDFTAPPRGTWCIDDGHVMRLGAITRRPRSLFYVVFTAGWCGFLYLMLSDGIMNSSFRALSFPFIATAIGCIAFGLFGCLMSLVGKTEVVIGDRHGYVFTGIGKFGWYRHFNLADVKDVRNKMIGDSTNTANMIQIIADRAISFGVLLKSSRSNYIVTKLHRILIDAPAPRPKGGAI